MNEKNFFHKRKSAPALLYEMEAPSTLIPIFLKTDIFFLRFSLPYANGVFGHKKCRFSKTVPRVKFFF